MDSGHLFAFDAQVCACDIVADLNVPAGQAEHLPSEMLPNNPGGQSSGVRTAVAATADEPVG